MKILIISDIHSNYEALLAVAEAEKDLSQTWCLGDLVDYGPQPTEVVQWVRHHVRHCVRGNHDHALAFNEDCRCSRRFRELSVLSREMNRALLTPPQIEYLRQLPITEDVTLEKYRFRLAHAAPGGDLYRYHLMPGIPDATLAAELEGIQADFIFCGHTHFPMVRKISDKLFVNPGSVGQPHDGDPRASYAVWEDGVVKLHRVKYDIGKTAKRLLASSLPIEAAQDLEQVLYTGGTTV